jgi:hypothetical protein
MQVLQQVVLLMFYCVEMPVMSLQLMLAMDNLRGDFDKMNESQFLIAPTSGI